MNIGVKVSGGLTLFGAIIIILAMLGDMTDGEGTYWKFFYAGIFFLGFGAFLMWLTGRD